MSQAASRMYDGLLEEVRLEHRASAVPGARKRPPLLRGQLEEDGVDPTLLEPLQRGTEPSWVETLMFPHLLHEAGPPKRLLRASRIPAEIRGVRSPSVVQQR